MVTLPRLDTYSEQERREFKKLSPISDLYLQHLNKKPLNFSDEVRIIKHQHWLECAFATLHEKYSAEEICGYWTQKTEEILDKTWTHVGLDQFNLTLLAFGKLGSFELNLSSDIDLVLLKENGADEKPINMAVKKWIQLLSEMTPLGFAYRVDLNLRPGGNTSPLVPSKNHFFNFYDDSLEAWHRMSFIRLRSLMTPKDLSQEVIEYCQRLCYPRRLDFSVIDEIKSLRAKLQFQWRKSNEPLDIKFYPGGIRDIELYVHALQVIYGGRNPSLRTSSISLAMDELFKLKVFDQETYSFLKVFYWQLRDIENRIHIYEDQQTYRLKPLILENLKFLSGEKELLEKLKRAENMAHRFFVENDSINRSSSDFSDRLKIDSTTPLRKKTLESHLNLKTPLSEKSQGAIDEIIRLKSSALKKGESEKIKEEILSLYLKATDKIAIDSELAIELFRDFVVAIKSKSSFFHLLKLYPDLLENLAWLFSLSPYIGQILCRRPELMDSFVLGQVQVDSDDTIENLIENLIDFKLLGQWMSIIYLLKHDDIISFHKEISSHADFISQHLLNHSIKASGCDKIDLLCLGKWSGAELGVHSDLDFIFLTESEPEMNQIKAARRFINQLTTPTKAGKLYNIDLRLKPNASSGPLIMKKEDLLNFLKTKAEAWHKQAYLRSRLLGTNDLYFKDQMDVLSMDSDESKELEEIHEKLLVPKNEKSLDVKNSAGGIVQTEFKLQKKCLLIRALPRSSSTVDIIESLNLSEDIANAIKANYLLLRKFEQILQITQDSPSTKVSIDNINLPRLSRILRVDDPFDSLNTILKEQEQLLKTLDLNH